MRRDVGRWACLAISVTLLASACTSAGDADSDQADVPAAVQPTVLNVMQFNIEYGGQGVDFSSVAKAIEAADADVVAIQEGYGKLPAIAADLGWDYYDARTQTVSKYPLLTPEDAVGGLIYVQVDGGMVAMFNLHLSSTAYGPNRVASGVAAADVLASETRVRLSALKPTLESASSLMEQDIPTFVLGDFNAPSHLDWTEATVGIRDHVRYPLQWPTSVAADEVGLVDVFRTIHPDPVQDQGLTWPASRPFVKGYNPGPNGAPADRVDLMYSGGPVEPKSVSIVGEEGADATDIAVSPWPSDHRAVVGTFEVLPGSPPPLVSTDQRLIEIGQDTSVRYYAETGDAATLAVVAPGGTSEQPLLEQPLEEPTSGSWPLPSNALDAGTYEVLLLAEDGRELARTKVWVVAPGSRPQISTDSATYSVGEPIKVRWNSSPGNKWDWLGVYDQGANPNVASYKYWSYTNATIAGESTFNGDSGKGRWPLPVGEYSVYLLADDSYVKLAGSDFSVVD